MVTTKVYLNTTDVDIDVMGVGVIPAHEHVSITSQYHQPVILENFPGVLDISDHDAEALAKVRPEIASAPETSVEPADETEVDVDEEVAK